MVAMSFLAIIAVTLQVSNLETTWLIRFKALVPTSSQIQPAIRIPVATKEAGSQLTNVMTHP